MKIEDILTEELVLPELGARNKTDVLVELASAVARRHPELERERLVQALEDRERLNSTALGDGVAIPHGKLPGHQARLRRLRAQPAGRRLPVARRPADASLLPAGGARGFGRART